MLNFWQNGKEVGISAISGNGKVGQLIILGERIDWGLNPTKYPLSKYPFLSTFTILEKKEGRQGSYVLKDTNGDSISLQANDACCLYDLQEWLTWNAAREAEKTSNNAKKIKQLENNIELLKDILIKQGVRIVTEEQAKSLNLV